MDINNINYLTFEGGGKGIVYLGAVRAIIMLIIILSLPSCNAQESQKDTIPEEFEFINVFLPEKLETITPNSLKKMLIAKNIIVTEYPTKYEYTEIIPLTHQDTIKTVKSTLNDYSLIGNITDSMIKFNIQGAYYFSENKDSLELVLIEISDEIFSENRYDSNIESKYQQLYDFLKTFLKEKYINKLNPQIEYFDESKMDFKDEIIQSVFWNFKNSRSLIEIEFTKRKQNDENWNNKIIIEITHSFH